MVNHISAKRKGYVMKKLISAFLAVVLVVVMIPVIGVRAETYGDLSYTIVNNEAVITRCSMFATGSIHIPSELEGYPVTRIYGDAFINCTKISRIYIPDTVVKIESGAFSWVGRNLKGIYVDENNQNYCTDSGILFNKDKTVLIRAPYTLEEYVVPSSVTQIGDSAFEGCKTLNEVAIGNNVTSIGSSAFWECTSLSSIIIPDSVTTIGGCAFYQCGNLSNVVFGNSVCEIGDYAFNYCNSLKTVTLPDSVTDFNRAFNQCASLTSIDIGNGVKSLDYRAFWDCSNLSIVTFGNSITWVSSNAFEGCESLINVYYRGTEDKWKNVTIKDGNFYLTERATIHFIAPIIYSGTCGENLTWTFNDESKELVISGTGNMDSFCSYIEVDHDGITVKGMNIPWKDFEIESVVISEGVTNISAIAFYDIQSLTSITIPSSVKVIESAAFASCWNLSNLVIPDGVEIIGNGAFQYCGNITHIYIPNSVTAIGISTFAGCDNLSIVTLGSNVSSIGKGAFSTCGILENIVLPELLSTIEYRTFFGSGLKSITIPSSVQSIDTLSFEDCFELTNVIIPDSVTYISNDAFKNCENIIIECKWNSYAHKYALKHNIPFVLSPYIYGDITGDEKINLTDVSTILKYIAKWDIEMNTEAADVNCDSKVNLTDVSTILKYIAKWDVVLGNSGSKPTDPPVPEPATDVLIISNTQTLSTQTIDTDVYITSTGNAIFENVTINGNIYCYGQLKCSGCNANNIYAYAYGSMMSCGAYDGTHGKVSGGINCNELKILDNALDYAFSKWGKK